MSPSRACLRALTVWHRCVLHDAWARVAFCSLHILAHCACRLEDAVVAEEVSPAQRACVLLRTGFTRASARAGTI
eukprot:3310807-Pleurochrysis_carterae.AAC.1